jgi:hypothetical protein
MLENQKSFNFVVGKINFTNNVAHLIFIPNLHIYTYRHNCLWKKIQIKSCDANIWILIKIKTTQNTLINFKLCSHIYFSFFPKSTVSTLIIAFVVVQTMFGICFWYFFPFFSPIPYLYKCFMLSLAYRLHIKIICSTINKLCSLAKKKFWFYENSYEMLKWYGGSIVAPWWTVFRNNSILAQTNILTFCISIKPLLMWQPHNIMLLITIKLEIIVNIRIKYGV